jgi:putative glutamine amidotransferase
LRPLIGISGYVEQARWGPWDTGAALLPRAYVAKVHAAGGEAAIIPPVSGAARSDRLAAHDAAESVVARVDALVLAGGADIDPSLYGAALDPKTGPLRHDRDIGELALLAAAYERRIPVLGICRGMELMAVAAGGKLVQHLPDVLGHHRHSPRRGVYGYHEVCTVPGTELAGVVGERLRVPSYHHQGVSDAGTLTVSAYADDGTIEAVEVSGGGAARFEVGVLWHPEISDDLRLFTALVAAARVVST